MKLSPGLEFLISQQGARPRKEKTLSNLIPGPELDESGDREIEAAGVKVEVLPMRPRKRGDHGRTN